MALTEKQIKLIREEYAYLGEGQIAHQIERAARVDKLARKEISRAVNRAAQDLEDSLTSFGNVSKFDVAARMREIQKDEVEDDSQ